MASKRSWPMGVKARVDKVVRKRVVERKKVRGL